MVCVLFQRFWTQFRDHWGWFEESLDKKPEQSGEDTSAAELVVFSGEEAAELFSIFAKHLFEILDNTSIKQDYFRPSEKLLTL